MKKKAHNPKKKLTNELHERFAREYVSNLDATRAYQLAKPNTSVKSANTAGNRLLARLDVRGRVEALQKQLAIKLDIKSEDITRAWAAMGFANLTEFYRQNPKGMLELKRIDELTPLQQYAIEEMEVTQGKRGVQIIKVKLASKQKALDSLAKHLGMFKEEGAAPTNVTMIMNGFTPKRNLDYVEKVK